MLSPIPTARGKAHSVSDVGGSGPNTLVPSNTESRHSNCDVIERVNQQEDGIIVCVALKTDHRPFRALSLLLESFDGLHVWRLSCAP